MSRARLTNDPGFYKVAEQAAACLESIAPGSERSFLFSTAVGVAANARRAQSRSREVVDTEGLLDARADDAPDAEELLSLKQARQSSRQPQRNSPPT